MSETSPDDEVLFYVSDGTHIPLSTDESGLLSIETWRPGRDGIPKFGLPMWPFVIWWIFHHLRIFSNPNCGVLIIKENDQIVHRSLVTPKWRRFPEMHKDDLQIGDTWTSRDARGRGLAGRAIAAIHEEWTGQFRKIWYLTSSQNVPSVKVVEKAGYSLAGIGRRTHSLVGRFIIERRGLDDRQSLPEE